MWVDSTMLDLKFPSLNSMQQNRSFCHLPISMWYKSSPRLNESDKDKRLKILIVRPSSIGDCLWMTPVIRKLKQKYPFSSIYVCTLFQELFENNPFLTDNMLFSKNNFCNKKIYDAIFEAYDKVYFLSYEFTPGFHPSKCYANIIGLDLGEDELTPELYLTEKEIEYGKNLIPSKFCLLHTECAWKSKRWDNYNWKRLGVKLLIESDTIIPHFISLRYNKEFYEFHQICNKTLRETISLVNTCQYLVAIDSGIMHIGTALGKKVVSLFGITDPNKILPSQYRDFAIQAKGEFTGCHHRQGNIPAEFEPKGVHSNFMKQIKPEDVMGMIGRL